MYDVVKCFGADDDVISIIDTKTVPGATHEQMCKDATGVATVEVPIEIHSRTAGTDGLFESMGPRVLRRSAMHLLPMA